MASKQTYECYVCRRQGFPDTRVYLDGKDENGKTIYKNTDMTPHIHKVKQSQEQQPKQTDYDNINNGISSFSMMTDLIRLVEQIQKLLVTMDSKVEHLTKLVYALSESERKERQT